MPVASSTNPLPDCFAFLHTVRRLDLGNIRQSISDECTVAIAFQNDDYAEVLAKCDDDVRTAQRLLERAALRIYTHREQS